MPARNTIDAMVSKFMEENILATFGFPKNIVIDNAQVFKN